MRVNGSCFQNQKYLLVLESNVMGECQKTKVGTWLESKSKREEQEENVPTNFASLQKNVQTFLKDGDFCNNQLHSRFDFTVEM